MNTLDIEQETWHTVRSELLSLQSALEYWASRSDYTVAERTHNGFMARGLGLAVEHWHVVSEDLESCESLRDQILHLITADRFSGTYNASVREGLRMAARLVWAVYVH